MKQKSSQMWFAPWPVVQAALALALSGLLLARPQAAAQGFAAGLKLCGGSLLPALFPLFVVCGLLGPLAPALGWPLRPLMRLCGIRSPRAPAVLVLGWCGGYAVCAQQIAALRKTGELPPRDAALLLLLGCCSGPGFVVGCIGGAAVWQRGAGAAAVWLAAGSQPCCRSLPGAIFAKAGIASWAGEQSTKERDLPTGHQQCGAK